MTRQRVRQDLVGSGVGYVLGLVALLVWPGREAVDQDVVLYVGLGILIFCNVATEILVFRRRPRFEWGGRPARYTALTFASLALASVILLMLRTSDLPSRGVIAYAVVALVILIGVNASNWLWARADDLEPSES